MKNRAHQSEKEVEVGVRSCDENDDVHDLCGRRVMHVSAHIFGFQGASFVADAISTHTDDSSNRTSFDDGHNQTLDNVVDGR